MTIRKWALAGAAAICVAASAPASADVIQLGFILDRSGSIGQTDWNIITSGLGTAIGNIPVGGPTTYEVSVVTFSDSATANIQRGPAGNMNPVSSAGIRPARTSEDLPQPEGPTTARKRRSLRRFNKSSVCSSRPKKMYASSRVNGRNPG